ncbi:uncharacterized protein LOC113501090 [Trichoplusia ni]|uniref:Uncharacterized protein LOC113501090 n=1 Tax=Trichoplusia ni TaxID=7111 RepID=A0A7E5WB18_TRINI|nr:uncharacterized protein LOC113501090 [Trichoplusia ni]
MERLDIVHTLNEDKGERVTSIYAENFFYDDSSDIQEKKKKEEAKKKPESHKYERQQEEPDWVDEWVSPSDLLIGILDLKPPFTSKITRGAAHEGILEIGDDVLDRERSRFLKYMHDVINDNDAAWSHILEHEKAAVAKKVKAIYHDILTNKSKTLMKEINIFYEKSLQELENHLRTEVSTVLLAAHSSIISDLNNEIKEKLNKERISLEKILQERHVSEINKIKHYYKILLHNEIYRNSQLVNHAVHERNDAIKAFYNQIEAQNTTSTMYVMCTERKKCKIRKFILDNIQSTEIAEKQQKIKERDDVIGAFKKKERQISDINKEWEEKIKKILQLFLKFVSFSLKLLPEQTTFLLDLEKMVVLQLNEIQKAPVKSPSILIDTDDLNILKFPEPPEPKETECEQPFVIEGNLLETDYRLLYGSRETLPSDVDLPYVRLQRKFIYAKCGRMDEVRDFLESQRCKCRDPPAKPPSPVTSSEPSTVHVSESASADKSDSSLEPLLMDDIRLLRECPVRNCQDWTKKFSFPYLNDYLDFSEEKYQRVKTILEPTPGKVIPPELVDPKAIVTQDLPFAKTKELYHHVETQYSSQEDLVTDFTCPCMDHYQQVPPELYPSDVKESPSDELQKILLRRKVSLQRIINNNPNLLGIFTDGDFDFTYTIK